MIPGVDRACGRFLDCGVGPVPASGRECDSELQRLIVDAAALGHFKIARFLIDSVSSILRIPGTLADWRKPA